jgi:cytidylate kinase
MPRVVIAIDGPAAAGKGTLAERLAEAFRLPYLDTGLLYRAIGRRMADEGASLDDAVVAGDYARRLATDDLARADLRGREAGELASRVAVHAPVRAALVDFQRAFAARPEGAVLDGRDIGTVICPGADVKLYVTASPEVRARRRTDELRAKGRDVDYDRILAEVRERDARDSNRSVAPLRPADDAVVIDTSDMDRDAAFETAAAVVRRVLSRLGS